MKWFFVPFMILLFPFCLKALDIQLDSENLSIISYTEEEYQRDLDLANLDDDTVFEFVPSIEILTGDVEDVRVYLSAGKIGLTPFQWDTPASGYHRFTLEKTGYETVSFVVFHDSESRTVVNVQLIRKTGYLNILDIPEGVRLTINDMEADSSTIPLEFGLYRLDFFQQERFLFSADILIGEEQQTVDYKMLESSSSGKEQREQFTEESVNETSPDLARTLNLHSGTSGMLFCPFPDVLPKYQGEFQTEIQTLIGLQESSFILDTGFAVAYGLPRQWDIALNAVGQFSLNQNAFAIGPQLTVKKKLIHSDQGFNAASAIKLGYHAPGKNFRQYHRDYNLFRISGLSVFFPLSFQFSSGIIGISPQMNMIPVSVEDWGDKGLFFEGIAFTGEMALGITFIIEKMQIGFSGRFLTPQISESEMESEYWIMQFALEGAYLFTENLSVLFNGIYSFAGSEHYCGFGFTICLSP